jgi:hypothetical protein
MRLQAETEYSWSEAAADFGVEDLHFAVVGGMMWPSVSTSACVSPCLLPNR